MALVLGLSPVEQGLYEILVTYAPMTATELTDLATARGWNEHSDGSVTERLLQRKLLVALPVDPPRYAATPPHAALEATVNARSQALARVREHMVTLSARFHHRDAPATDDPMIEVVHGRPAIEQCLADLSNSARHEIWGIDSPPYFGDPGGGWGSVVDTRHDKRKLTYRALYAQVSAPSRLGFLSMARSANEQARVGDVPVKMFVYDRRTVLMPFDHVTVPITAFVLIRDPALVPVLVAMFELYWNRAVPVNVRNGQIHTEDVPDIDREVLALMVAGLTDRAIARQLGWAERTVRRRIGKIIVHLGATTRFQAGYLAVARGLLSINPEGAIEPVGIHEPTEYDSRS